MPPVWCDAEEFVGDVVEVGGFDVLEEVAGDDIVEGAVLVGEVAGVLDSAAVSYFQVVPDVVEVWVEVEAVPVGVLGDGLSSAAAGVENLLVGEVHEGGPERPA